jgi:protein-S-isoprenylcysteine O-methyltransferase Ste14
MLALARHLFAIAVLPFTVAVLVPVWIGGELAFASTAGELALQVTGLAALAVGLVLFAASLRHFATRGRGTLAPWDPPKNLVVTGPYRYVRNPMIAGVMFILFGEAGVLRSWPQTEWALTFLAINLVYIPLLEEPGLVLRFGDSYREYRRHVWMFVPRLRPWTPPHRDAPADSTGASA